MLIPPSLLLILYGILTEQSIGDLFVAAIIPGILLAIVFGFGFFINYLFWVKNPFFVFEETKFFFQSQVEGMEIFESIINEHNIDCEKAGMGNLDVAHHASSCEELKEWGNDL